LASVSASEWALLSEWESVSEPVFLSALASQTVMA
jgi:hypothetical protein